MFVSAFVAMSSSASVGSGWGALSSLGGGADSVSLSPVYAKSYRITLAAPAGDMAWPGPFGFPAVRSPPFTQDLLLIALRIPLQDALVV